MSGKNKSVMKLIIAVGLICGSVALILKGKRVLDYRKSVFGIKDNYCLIAPSGCEFEFTSSKVAFRCEGGSAVLSEENELPNRDEFSEIVDNKELGVKSYYKFEKDGLTQRFVGDRVNLSFKANYSDKKLINPAIITSCTNSFGDNFRLNWK